MCVYRLRNWKIPFLVLAVLIIFQSKSHAQWDDSKTRYLSRSKLWSTYRMTGQQGQQAYPGPATNDQAGLSYPGSSIRTGEYVEYWNASIIDQSTGGAGAKSPNSARNVNSHGEGTYIMAKAGDKKFVSYSGPRTVSTDVVKVGYDPVYGPEADLGVDDAKSSYWPGAPQIDPEEPVEIHNYQYHCSYVAATGDTLSPVRVNSKGRNTKGNFGDCEITNFFLFHVQS